MPPLLLQGEEADGMYFVESGSVNITLTESDATEREVSVCRAGSYLGMGVLVMRKLFENINL